MKQNNPKLFCIFQKDFTKMDYDNYTGIMGVRIHHVMGGFENGQIPWRNKTTAIENWFEESGSKIWNFLVSHIKSLQIWDL